MKILRHTIALFLATSLATTAMSASAQTAVKPDGSQAALQVDTSSNLKVTINNSSDANGLVVQPALSSTFWSYPAASGGITNSTVGVTARAAAGAGVRIYVKSLQLTADALGAATEFIISDGAAGTVMARIKVNTGGIAGSGTTIFDPPLRGTANTLVEIRAVTASITGGLFANLQGYTGTGN